jgi:hypothetical protein
MGNGKESTDEGLDLTASSKGSMAGKASKAHFSDDGSGLKP